METPKRILIKISGEAIAGSNPDGKGIDMKFVSWAAKEIKKTVDELGVEIAIVVGGGNFIRGAEFESGGEVDQATAHYMGMMTTVLNGQVLMDSLQHNGQPARVTSAIAVDQVAEPFIRRKVIRHLEKGRVVVLSGGIGKPFMTTDTAAVTYALELGCQEVYKATQVDGVYNKDPNEFKDAVRFDKISYQKAIEDPNIKVMDKAALGLAMEQNMPVTIFELGKEDNILKVVSGENIGTRVS